MQIFAGKLALRLLSASLSPLECELVAWVRPAQTFEPWHPAVKNELLLEQLEQPQGLSGGSYRRQCVRAIFWTNRSESLASTGASRCRHRPRSLGETHSRRATSRAENHRRRQSTQREAHARIEVKVCVSRRFTFQSNSKLYPSQKRNRPWAAFKGHLTSSVD
jgi:hypothetical protein